MSRASSSIDRPAFTRRTLDCDSTSLLKGISRDALRAIFWMALAMAGHSVTDGRKPLSHP
jgi:hypothetical protein